ncbi:MAG: hypothetical protein LBS93_03855, partial [Synergistaceae bacterium]|nr:hypothetical protein [Synergistaceae bacterium]
MEENEIARLRERIAELEAEREPEKPMKNEKALAAGLRRNLYEHVTVSLRTLDIIIAACAILIVILVIAGAIQGRF